MSKPKKPYPCAPRRRFANRDDCFAAAVRIANVNKVRRYVVGCDKCGGWHLAREQE